MIINMREGASEQEIQHVIERVKEAGFQAHVTRGTERDCRGRWQQWTPSRIAGVSRRSRRDRSGSHRAAVQAS